MSSSEFRRICRHSQNLQRYGPARNITVSGDLALVLQYEHMWFHSPGQERNRNVTIGSPPRCVVKRENGALFTATPIR